MTNSPVPKTPRAQKNKDKIKMRLRARQDDYANDLAQGPPLYSLVTFDFRILFPLLLGLGLGRYQGPESKCDPDMYWVTESKEMARGTPRDQVSKSNCPGPVPCEQGRNAHRSPREEVSQTRGQGRQAREPDTGRSYSDN